MTQAPIREQVRKAFAWLFDEQGFDFVESPENSDFVAVAQSGTIRLRFVHDRADTFLDVAGGGEHGKWVDIHEMLDVMQQKGLVGQRDGRANRVGQLSKLLRSYLPALHHYLTEASPERVAELIRLLRDESAVVTDREDAATELARFDDPAVRAALSDVATTSGADEELAENAADSLAEIWCRTETFDRSVYDRLTGYALGSARAVIKRCHAEWLVERPIEFRNAILDALAPRLRQFGLSVAGHERIAGTERIWLRNQATGLVLILDLIDRATMIYVYALGADPVAPAEWRRLPHFEAIWWTRLRDPASTYKGPDFDPDEASIVRAMQSRFEELARVAPDVLKGDHSSMADVAQLADRAQHDVRAEDGA